VEDSKGKWRTGLFPKEEAMEGMREGVRENYRGNREGERKGSF